jgi:hypothetical protein
MQKAHSSGPAGPRAEGRRMVLVRSLSLPFVTVATMLIDDDKTGRGEE